MSYTKGVWKVGRGGYCVVSQEPAPEVNGSDAVEYYGGHLIGESMSEANAKRIVECVSACDGMENPTDEIAKLLSERDELLRVMIEIKADCDEASSYGDKVCVATLEIDRVIELCGGK